MSSRLIPRTCAFTVALAAALLAPSAASAATQIFTGTVSATGTTSQAFVVTAPANGRLAATLTWTSPTARLTVGLSQPSSNGTWAWVASANGAQPVTLTWPVTTGTWRVYVKSTSGASDYSLTVTTPDGQSQPPPFVTLLFSRTEMTAAQNCAADNLDVARLGTVVAPALAARGLHPTGTVETGVTRDDVESCLHYRRTLGGSWDDLTMLADTYGWTFVSHSRSYAKDIGTLTPNEAWNETCGSILDLELHGFMRADGLFAWPDNKWDATAQASTVASCFAFGRQYGSGITTLAQGTTPPYWQSTRGLSGGRCADASLPCHTYRTDTAYRSPASIEAKLATLQPGQWMTVQSYVFVTGSRPGMWNCTGSSWRSHWTMDVERYCWNDYQSILDAIPATATVTDPKTVAEAWGRTNYTPPATG
jgi:hypothetical protein